MYVMWNNLVTRLTNAEMVVKSKEHQMWETRKRTRGLGIGTYPAYAFYLSGYLFYYVGNLTTGTRICISNVHRKQNFVTRLSNTDMVDKSRNFLTTAYMKMNSATRSKTNRHNLSLRRSRVRIKNVYYNWTRHPGDLMFLHLSVLGSTIMEH